MSKFKNIINALTNKVVEEAPVPVTATVTSPEKPPSNDITKIGDFEEYRVYRTPEDNDGYETLFLVADGDETPALYVQFSELGDKGIVMKNVWQSPSKRGLAQNFYTNFLLEKYPMVISDKEMTLAGLSFYEKLVTSDLTVRVMDTETNEVGRIDDPDELSYYFGRDDGKYRYVLTKK